MKRLLFALAFTISIIANAQHYPGTKPELLLNRQLKVLSDESSKKFGYNNFYSAATMRSGDTYKKSARYTTPYEELAGKTFTVTEIAPHGTGKYASFRLTLKSDGLPVLYYDYNPKYDTDYKFEVVGGLKMPEGYYCNDFKPVEESSYNRTEVPVFEGMVIAREIFNGKVVIKLSATLLHKKPFDTKDGIVLTLQNGKMINKPLAPVRISFNERGGGFFYFVATDLTTNDLKLLSESPLVSISTTFLEEPFKKGYQLSEYAKCLLK